MPSRSNNTKNNTGSTSGSADILTRENIKSYIQEALNEALPTLIEEAISPLLTKLEDYKKMNSDLTKRIEILENQLVSDQLEIGGIPISPDGTENTDDIAKRVLQLLQLDNVNISTAIISSFRLPKPKLTTSKNPPPPKIIVKLANANIKRIAYRNRIKHQIKIADLGISGSGSGRVFVNERLRPSLRPTFYKLIELKRNKSIHSVWTHNQEIMVKVHKDDPAEHVKDFESFLSTI
jgi:hypothetical protein